MGDPLSTFKRAGSILKMAVSATQMTGYWYHRQPVGEAYAPDRIEGYFSDLRHKTDWPGPTDPDGIPMNSPPEGDPFYYPTSVFQKGLGHWDRYLLEDSEEEKDEFLNIARWAADNIDRRGGWTAWSLSSNRYETDYSAMAQGQGISVLVRASKENSEYDWLGKAAEAADLMLTPVKEGGTLRHHGPGFVLEEYPTEDLNGVLNGWIFATFGLHDLALVTDDNEVEKALDTSLSTVAAELPRYDAGFWSLYDLAGNISLPFYQQLHVDQLRALDLTYPGLADFGKWADIFEGYMDQRRNWIRALVRKGREKLDDPPVIRR